MLNVAAWLLLLLLAVPSPESLPEGLVVETVEGGSAGDLAGLRPGDLLLRWARSPNGPSDEGVSEQAARPFTPIEIDREQLPRGSVTLRVSRAGQPLTIVLPWEGMALGTTFRPAFSPRLADLYERGRVLADEGKLEEATAAWREVAEISRELEGGLEWACWMFARAGSRWLPKDPAASGRLYREAALCVEPLGPRALAALLEEQGGTASPPSGFPQRIEAYQHALKLRREAGSGVVAQASDVHSLAVLALQLGNQEQAMAHFREAVSLLEAATPEGPPLANELGMMSFYTNDLDAAEAVLARAAAIAERHNPDGMAMAGVLSAQVRIARHRGDLARAEQAARRQLAINRKRAPESAMVAIGQLNLGGLARSRGDLDAAEDWYRSALAIGDRLDEKAGVRATVLLGLSNIAQDRGDLGAAESLLRRALKGFESFGSGRVATIMAYTSLGSLLVRRGDREGARPIVERALALSEQGSRGTNWEALALGGLGDLQRDGGELDAAEASYERARKILERIAPEGASLAEVIHRLGTVQRARGNPAEAATLFARAIEMLETQRGRVGTTDEARSLFASRFYGVYHDQAEVLVGLGRSSEAFQVSERGRARALLTLMAERDLILEDPAPPELDRRRRQLDAEYEDARGALNRLSADSNAPRLDELAGKLRELRNKQAEVMDRIRQASPRLAEFRDPQPLDADRIRAALDPGTALLVYSVAAKSTVLFVLTAPDSGESGLAATVLPLGSDALGPRIAAWRRLAERSAPPPEFFAEGRALYDLLIRPVEDRLVSAQRLVFCPDGPLHQLSFAALRRNGAYLAEWKAFTLVPSGTVLAQLGQSRPSTPRASTLIAFGDPRAPGLPTLEGSGPEVAAITRLFPGARAYLGAEATEERLKALGAGARYFHFAGHGLIDGRLPLESALAFSPTPSAGERDDGRLHAWEIFERLRLDADLVTLSACRSAAGTEVAGEGVLGLTRAFQYAGARSVLASLWRVPDKSTPPFMSRFYRGLKQGLSKDEALRRAQLGSIRAGHHPVRWATFQLYGDWR